MRSILGELKPDEGEIIIMDNDSKLKETDWLRCPEWDQQSEFPSNG